MLLTGPDGRLVVLPDAELFIYDDQLQRRDASGATDRCSGALKHGTELTEAGWSWLQLRGYLGRFFVAPQASSYLPSTYLQSDARELSRHLKKAPGKGPVLVVCCGSHSLARNLAHLGHDIEGIDIEEEVVRALTEAAPADASAAGRVTYTVADAANFARPAQYLGAVCALNGVRYLATPGRIKRYLQLMSMSLRPGAIYAIHVSFAATVGVDRWQSDDGSEVTWSVERAEGDEVMETVQVSLPDGLELADRHVQLVLSPAWFEAVLERAGFVVSQVYDDDWAPAPMTSDGNLWVLAQRREVLA